jgi:tripartite-type tricarboxylate transporter receptor subunit TctC
MTVERVFNPVASCAVHAAVSGALLIAAQLACAQQPAYPEKTIRLVAMQAPGGGIDAVSRLLGSRLSEAVGQTVIVDNRPGANGSLAGALTAKSPPDGYTLMLGSAGPLAINTLFYRKLSYAPLQDLASVTRVVSGSQILVVHPSVPARSVKELIALARAQPGALAYGSSGRGSTGHLSGEMLQTMAQIKMLHVPYKGGAPAMVDLVAGQVQVGFASMTTAIPNINSGRLRALAVTAAERSKILPDLQTIAEAGVPGYESNSWYGLVVAAQTPPAIVTRLNKEIVQILNQRDTAAALLKLGLEVWPSTPEEFGAHRKAEYERWAQVVKAAGITAN